ncbi:MAG TPA: rhomboid family intramembrane serine protease [Planctomycetaceae bacterium]|nr:rhomboid family intramembrane serine protease [Planctomycetaceae bacterium]
MGIEGRDYIRDGDSYTDRVAGWNLNAIPPMTKRLIIVNVVVFVLQLVITREANRADWEALLRSHGVSTEQVTEEALSAVRPERMRISVVEDWCQFETDKVLHGQIWRLMTSSFCHDTNSLWHLLLNMLFLYWAGEALEFSYGSREFLLLYLTAAVVASLTYFTLDLLTPATGPMIGASGAVMAVLMLFAIHYPRHTIRLFFFFPLEMRWLILLYVAYDLHPVLLALGGRDLSTGVAHAAHLGGFAFGFFYWKYQLRLEPLWDRLTRRLPRFERSASPSRSEAATFSAPDPLDEEVDDLLRKIHEQGEASLTDAERDVLKVASERYKTRRR